VIESKIRWRSASSPVKTATFTPSNSRVSWVQPSPVVWMPTGCRRALNQT
jgi:hypothetical protein